MSKLKTMSMIEWLQFKWDRMLRRGFAPQVVVMSASVWQDYRRELLDRSNYQGLEDFRRFNGIPVYISSAIRTGEVRIY